MVHTHCLAHACMSRLIDAAYKDPAGERDVEAKVDQHVPELAAHTDGPEVTETNQSPITKGQMGHSLTHSANVSG